ncbi:MAG: hypothetical protein IJ127_06810 [Afipia sp.]|uniref:Uncharacterized protein n=1 Tax=Candidatus Afipia apatlaquensis TaxID=2712852 RepID=A0A7C9RE64_9BRAD|nr:hypothetical protein [Afipia sp.]NGX95265.1 hypothetical protein [Candidatus Afipia apatlaquensis]
MQRNLSGRAPLENGESSGLDDDQLLDSDRCRIAKAPTLRRLPLTIIALDFCGIASLALPLEL